MISLVITSFKEPELVQKAIAAILDNPIKEEYELLVAAPDKETEIIVNKIAKQHPQVKYFKDPGKGKSYALNLIFKELQGRIWIFTDGDVYIEKNAVNKLIEAFDDELVGCASGRPVSTNPKNNMLGFWSHLLYDAGAHQIRKELSKKNQFLECSAYLFAFKDNITRNIPLNVAEDAIIPYLTMKKGYKIRYVEDALVYVKNPTTIKDFIKQRVRTAKAHETLEDYAPFFPKVKSFSNEVKKGSKWALQYPRKFTEYLWTFALFATRLFIWLNVIWDDRVVKKRYGDAWERIESTK